MPYHGRMTVDVDQGTIPQWTVSDRLRKARECAGMEQAELAARVGIARNTVSNYERGATPPKRPVLLSWALACGVPLVWLQDGVEPTSPTSGDALPAGSWPVLSLVA